MSPSVYTVFLMFPQLYIRILISIFGSDGDLKTDAVVEIQNDFLTITNLLSPDILIGKNVKLE